METRDFGWALRHIKAGKTASRPGWVKGRFAYQVPAYADEGFITHSFLATADLDRSAAVWAASHDDLLAEDWQLGPS